MKENRKVKICFFSGDITRSGGTERVAIQIANELQKQGKYSISFVSLYEGHQEVFFELDRNIVRYQLYNTIVSGKTHFLGYIYRLKKIVESNALDILVDIDGIIDIYSVPVKWITGVKVISWEHFNYYFHPTQKFRQKVRKFAVKNVNAIVTLTEQDKRYYLENLRIPCLIYAIYNPIIFSEKNNIYNEQSKILISVGRLTYQKGFDRLIDVADIVLNNHMDWKWIVLGEGEDKELLQKKIADKKLTGRLQLLGNVKNVDEYYKKSSVFVMTSRFEGLPMTLLEAKNYKLPIVSYDIKTGPRECIQHGINGYLVEDGNAKDMAEKIEKLIVDRDMRKDFSEKALMNVEKFSLEKIIYEWNKLIEEVMES